MNMDEGAGKAEEVRPRLSPWGGGVKPLLEVGGEGKYQVSPPWGKARRLLWRVCAAFPREAIDARPRVASGRCPRGLGVSLALVVGAASPRALWGALGSRLRQAGVAPASPECGSRAGGSSQAVPGTSSPACVG